MSAQTTSADRAALAREARWQKLLDTVDPEGLMAPEDREDAARALRRRQLAEYARVGRKRQSDQQAQFRTFLKRRDELVRLHEEMADMLRGGA